MKHISLKQGLLILMVALLTLFWVGSVSGMPPGWGGFHANLKGFPGWTDADQHIQPLDSLEVLGTTLEAEQQRDYSPHDYQGFGGATNGNFTETRPRGN